jgi:hypothetical protein
MSPDFYRREAERLRRLADDQTDPELAQKLRQMAAENDALAAELEPKGDKGGPSPPAMHVPMQQQPIQQQQSKTDPDDKT